MPFQKSFSDCTVVIAGLGLMGGSLGLALRGKVTQVVGVARRQETIDEALRLGAIDQGFETLDVALADADIIVLSTPVGVILRQIEEIGDLAARGKVKTSAVVTDMGSTKAQICQALAGLPAGIQAVGAHPMCGKETSGLAVADAGLYHGAPYVLCPLPRATPKAVGLVEAMALAAGARPLRMAASRHDRLVAAISHLPYVLATALFATVDGVGQKDDMVWQLAASGFRSMTRLAGSDDQMMADILLTNQAAVLEMIEHLRANLDGIAALVRDENDTRLRDVSRSVRKRRAEFLAQYGE